MTGRWVERLTLSHFRSHARLEIAPDARPVAIFGPNGAGKTNLLEAVSLLSPGRGIRRAQADDIAARGAALGWKVSGRISEGRGPGHEIDLRHEPGGQREVRIDGKVARQHALGRILRIIWLVPSMDRIWSEGAEGRRRFLDRVTLSFLPGHAEASLAYEKAMRERNRLLKDQVRDGHWYRALEGQMATQGALIMASRRDAVGRIRAAQQEAGSAFPVAELDLVAGGEETEEGLLRSFHDGRAADLAAGRTLSGPHRGDLSVHYAAKGIPARECSTGEQKALLISIVLANARALAAETGQPPILLLDEVAAHLDADRRARLYDEICAIGTQAWMTGTGSDLFDGLGTRAQYLAVNETDGQSTVECA